LGDRIFDYLLKSELLQAYTPNERLTVWNQFIGNNIALSDAKLHANPLLNRSRIDNLTLAEHLESILDFYNEIGLEKAAAIIRKEIVKVWVYDVLCGYKVSIPCGHIRRDKFIMLLKS
jgi:hypothetical protein